MKMIRRQSTDMGFGKSFFGALMRLDGVSTKLFKTTSDAQSILKQIESGLLDVGKAVGDDATITVYKRLFKSVLDAGRVVSNPADGIKIKFFTKANNVVDPHDLVESVRFGNLEKLLDTLKITKTKELSSKSLHNSFRNVFTRAFPDAEVKNTLKKGLNKSVPQVMYNTPVSGVTEMFELFKKDKTFRRMVNNLTKLTGKSRYPIISKGLFLTITITGSTTVAVLSALNAAAEKAVGCWRVYRVNGKLKKCLSVYASCTRLDLNMENVCQTYPVVHTIDACKTWDKITPCTQCNAAADRSSSNYLDTHSFVDATDLYVCQSKPSLGYVLGHLAADVPSMLDGIVETTISAVKSVWNGFKGVLIFVAVFILLVGFGCYAYKVYAGKTNSDDGVKKNKNDLFVKVRDKIMSKKLK